MTKQKFWEMTRNETTKTSAEITIYGTIGNSWWDESVSASQFSKDLKALGEEIKELTVRINSAGGSVFDGLAIRSLLKNHKAHVTIHVDGWAASIASIIAMAGDKIIMAKGSMMMIHNPVSGGWGESKELRDIADFLDKVRDSLVSVYSSRTNKSAEDLIALLDKETWMSAEDAVEEGFADEVEDGVPVSASMVGAVAVVNGVNMDYSKFQNTPKLPRKEIQNMVETKEEENLKTIEELKNKYPELYNQVKKEGYEEGVSVENQRFKEIEELPLNGFEDLVTKAKFETKASASTLAMDILKAQKNKGADFLANRVKDAEILNTVEGDAAPEGGELTEEQEIENQGNQLANIINKKQGGVQ